MLSVRSLICLLVIALMGVGNLVKAAPWTPDRPLYFYRLRSYDSDPLDFAPVERLAKRSAIKRERILDSLGGDYLIKRSL